MRDAAEDLRTARRFAALSGPFRPGDAFAAVSPALAEDATQLVDLAAALARTCDTGLGTDAWLMRGSERRWELEGMGADLAGQVAWRRGAPHDGATDDLLAALTGEAPFSDAAVEALVQAGGPRDRLERAAVALDRAGPLAPASRRLDAVRSALARLDAGERNAALLQPAFVGRRGELKRVEAWIDRPLDGPPTAALYIRGLPGVGKSTLLEKAASVALARRPPRVVVRLDFDRVGLDVQDAVGLTLELARQVDGQLTEPTQDLRAARLQAAGGDRGAGALKGAAREMVPVELARAVAGARAGSGRPLLLILDTLEVLRGRGETHPDRLFGWIDKLCAAGVRPVSILAAGRGDALGSAPARVAGEIDLPGLDDDEADLLLERLGAPEPSWSALREVAEGNPLALRLGALVVRQAGPASLERRAGRREVAAAHLYRVLLSRIPEEDLRRLAHPGLVARRISAQLIEEVLAPQLGLGAIGPVRAAQLFEALAGQHWLVESDAATPGFVKHRADMRGVLLRLLYADSPARCAKIDRAAARWFARRPEPWCAVEAAYHRLQLMRRGEAPVALDPDVLRLFDEEMISELPQEAQDVARQRRGERSSIGRRGEGAAVATGVLPPGAGVELEGMIERGDWIEGRHFYEAVLADAYVDPRSRTADAVRTFLWRSGDWGRALRLLRDREDGPADDLDIGDLPPQLAAARLEMRAESAFQPLVRALRSDGVLAGIAESRASLDLKSGLGAGALGLALRQARARPREGAWRGPDPVESAFAAAWGSADDLEARARTLTAAVQMLSAHVRAAPVDPDRPDVAARLLATLSPYGRIGATLAEARNDDRDQPLFHALTVVRRLAAHQALPPEGAAGWSFTAETYGRAAIESLTAVGLFAEWAGAAAHVLQAAGDLRLIARSAERWRRTMAGRWSYGAPPAGWRRGPDRPDATIEARVTALASAPDPVGASRDQLAIWTWPDDVDVERWLERLARRFRAAIALAGRTEDPVAAAAVMQRSGVPSAFIPLAVMTARRALRSDAT